MASASGEHVPNEVFRHAFEGLCALVSRRVADQILRSALKGTGRDPETVDGNSMSLLLMGPVRQELERVLPRRGLRFSLESLSRRVDRLSGALVELEPGAPRAEPTDAPPLMEPVPSGSDCGTETAGGLKADQISSGRARPGAEVGFAAVPEPRLEPPAFDPDLLIERLMVMDEVRLVANYDTAGRALRVLGEGVDVDELGRAGRLALRLLERDQPVRTLHLEHSQGELYLFPHGDGLVALFGTPALNLGAVLATFAALVTEEDR